MTSDSSSFFDLIRQIVNNTRPLDLFEHNLGWWSFGIASIGLFVSILAATYSYLGYKYQKKSSESLDLMLPGRINLFAVSKSIIKIIFDLKSLFYGKTPHTSFPVKLIMEMNKLPDDLIDLKKYEKDADCYDAAFNTVLAWRNYNVFLDSLIELSSNSKESNKINSFVFYLIELTKAQIAVIQKFENTLFENGYLSEQSSTKELFAWYILDLFFEYLQNISSIENDSLKSCFENNSVDQIDILPFDKFLPQTICIEEYLKAKHKHSLKSLGYVLDVKKVYQTLLNGEYDYISQFLPQKELAPISTINFNDFENAFKFYIEPIIIGTSRYNYSLIKL